MTAIGDAVLTQTGQNLQVNVPAGVASIAKSGSAALTAAVTLTGAGQVSLTQSAQNIGISVPALTTTREHLEGNAVSIANNVQQKLTWDTAAGGSTVLATTGAGSLTEPVLATPSGIYCLVCNFTPAEAMTIGGSYQAYLSLDVYDQEVFFKMDSAPATAAQRTPNVTITACYYMAVGSTVHAIVLNQDGSTRTFNIALATIQRIN